MSGAAMPWPSPPSRSQTHGLLMSKTGCPDRLGPRKVMGRVWRKSEVWGTSSNTFESSLSNPLSLAISKSFHLEGKRDSPSGFVHCCETSAATRAAHKKNQKMLMLVQKMCQQDQICIFACIGHVFSKMEMYYVCIRTFIIRNTFITV
jgi:hypothetical protein